MNKTIPLKINIDLDRYGTYRFNPNMYIIAIKIEDIQKINLLQQEHGSIEEIPNEETINGIILHYNESNGTYSIMHEISHKFKINDLTAMTIKLDYNKFLGFI